MTCANCGETLDTEHFYYCSSCGILNPNCRPRTLGKEKDDYVVCDFHLENPAVGFCVVCGRAVCEECAVRSESKLPAGRKILCNDPTHAEYLNKWKVIHRFDFDYEAAMLYANLDQRGIETQVFTKLNPNTTEISSRPTIVEVLVQSENGAAAEEVVKLLGLNEEKENEN